MAWGAGNVMREPFHFDDLAVVPGHVMGLEKSEIEFAAGSMCSHINIGIRVDVTISELAETIKLVVFFEDGLKFNSIKPDGTSRKLLDVSKISLPWSSEDLVA